MNVLQRFRGSAAVILGAAVIALLPQLGLDAYWQREVLLVAISALIVSGLNLSLGYAGELALGQVAMYAVGAYTAGYLAVHGHTDLLLSLLAGAVAAALAGLVSGIPGVRLGTWSLAMVSFFLVLLIPDVVSLTSSVTGGQNGLIGIPEATLFGQGLGAGSFYVTVIVIGCIWFLLLRSFLRSRHGDALRVLRQSPVLARSMGLSVTRTKMTAYVLGGIPAGLAGVIYAYLQRFLSPTGFDFSLSVAVIAASVIGGSESVFGAIFGAALLQVGPLLSGGFAKYSLLVYGLFMLAGAVLFAGGLAATGRRLLIRLRPRGRTLASRRAGAAVTAAPLSAASDAPPAGAGTPSPRVSATLQGATLRVEGVSKSFGGSVALRDVSLTASPGRITAIIGPNGSGKTTLLNVISGFIKADTGSVSLGESLISALPAHQVARQGVARTFQTPLIPLSLDVRAAVQASRFVRPYVGVASSALRLPKYRRVARHDDDVVSTALQTLGLADLAAEPAAELPLGTRRVLEIARAVAAEPALLLLDEPASGLDQNEIEAFAAILASLRDAGATIVLVEHNFPLVLRLADEIHVLASGSVLASGPPEEIAGNAAVAESYLGIAPTAADPAEQPVPVSS